MLMRYVPFKARKGLQVWPDGVRMAVAAYVGLEEWDADLVVKYDAPPPLGPRLLRGQQSPDLAILTTAQYGYRVGIYRLMEVFDRHQLRFSVLANGLAVERHTPLFQELHEAGHPFVGHAWEQSTWHARMTPEEVRQDIDRCIAVFKDRVNVSLNGWGSPGTRQYPVTLETLFDRGFSFHQGLRNDELPYLLEHNGQTMVEIPYRIGESGELNDHHISRFPGRVGEEIFETYRALADARHAESVVRPQFLGLGVHPYVSGRPDRAQAVSRLLGHLKGLPGVWVTTFNEVADWWKQVADKLPAEEEELG